MSGAGKRGLGRGLGSLIPAAGSDAAQAPNHPPRAPAKRASAQDRAPDVAAEAVYAEVPIESISINPRQPRSVFDQEALDELTSSIREIGLLQPLVVRRHAGAFELIAGERRLRACRANGMTTVPVIIRQTTDDEVLREALLENLHRADLNALEEAAAYAQLLSDFGCTQEELSRRLSRSRPQISNTLRLLRLPPSVQRRVAAGVLSAGHARALLALPDEDAMEALAHRIVAEGLSVRTVEELVILNDGPGRKPRKRHVERSPEHLDTIADIQQRLSDRLETRVSLQGFGSPKAKGRIVITCADVEDLHRVLDALRVVE